MRSDDLTTTLYTRLDALLAPGEHPAFDVLIARDPELRQQLEADPQLRDDLTHHFQALRAVDKQFRRGAEGDQPKPPEVHGYEVHGVIGRGAMGVVYKGRQLSVGRPVALKVLSIARLGNPTSVARFRREADLAARLSHPNIIQVYDAGSLDGVPYIVQELIDGATLAQTLDGKPLPCQEAARLVRTLSTAIEYAHQRGIVHRDLKPSNVLIDSNGIPKIADFGLAKLLAGEDLLTKMGEIAGTPQYMAPEQASGKMEVGPATDVYALGVILYETLTGRLPIEGQSDIDTLNRVLADEPAAPRLIRPGIPEDLQTICLTCLEKDPRNRYRGAQELADDLTRYLEHWPIKARPAGRVRRMVKWARRRPTTAALSAVIAVSLIAAALGGWWHSLRLTETLDESNSLRLEADAARQLAEAGARNLRRQLFPSKIRVAHMAAQLSDVARATRIMDEALQEESLLTRKCFAARHVWGICHEEDHILNGHQGEVYFAVFSPDGKSVAVGGEDGSVKLWDAKTGRETATLRRHTSCVNQMVYSPDGRQLVTVSCDKTVRLWDMVSREEQAIVAQGTGVFLTAAVSPDGARLATSGESTVQVWDWKTLKLLASVKSESGQRVDSVRFLKDGRLISNGYGNRLRLRNLKENRWDWVPLNVPYGEGHVRDLDVSPDGRVLACTYNAGPQSRVILIDTQTWKEIGSIPHHASAARSVTFSPDGFLLATGTQDFLIHIWEVSSRRLRTTLTGHSDWINSLAFSADSRRLVSTSNDGTARIWNLERPVGRRFLSAPPGTGPMAFTSCGRYLVSQHDRTVIIRDVEDWKERTRIDDCDTLAVGTSPKMPGRQAGDRRSLLAVAKGKDVEVWDAAQSRRVLAFQPTGATVIAMAMAGEPPVLAVSDKSGRKVLWDLGLTKVVGTDATHGRQLTVAPARLADSLPNARQTTLTMSTFIPWIALSQTAARAGWLQRDSAHIFMCDLSSTAADATPADKSGPRALTILPEGSALVGIHRQDVQKVVFSPDGKLLASTSLDSTVRLWDADSRKERATLVGHSEGTLGIAFSPDGCTLASGGGDRAVRVWDVQTQLELLAFDGHRAAVDRVAFSPDGTALASLCGNPGEPSEITIWFAPLIPAAEAPIVSAAQN